MFDGMVMILFAFILFLVAVFVWAYKDKQYIEREIEWGREEQKVAMVLGELVERHYNVMECIDKRINRAKERRIPKRINVKMKGIDEFEDGLDDEFEDDYWNGVYKELKSLKEEIENDDKFHIKIEKITKER